MKKVIANWVLDYETGWPCGYWFKTELGYKFICMYTSQESRYFQTHHQVIQHIFDEAMLPEMQRIEVNVPTNRS